ncbi:unnamed protein product [Dracunculus medinensis]|uniref:C2H2-type domain-containing protein n=1 Tax=Dracunculus medinensis TaxID=318479 RepID=A0A0N4U4N9_DRAME|nr:unnamed protein product [Dracunculus medinensis]
MRRSDTSHLTTCGFHESRLVYEGAVLVCECEGCIINVYFRYEILQYVSHLNLHIGLFDETDRDNKRTYKCRWKARLLREHCSRHVVNLKCERCAIMVGSPSALHRHILTVHKQKLTLKQKLYRCLRNEISLAETNHKLTNHDYSPYTHLCHVCFAKYTNGFGLTRHLKVKHNFTIPTGFTRFQYKKCADVVLADTI